MVLHVLQVDQSAGELPAINRLRCLAGVLVGDTEVGAARARGFGGLDVGGCVADLAKRGGGLVAVERFI